MHKQVNLDLNNNPKKKPETILYYNSTKYGIDVIDQMARKYSVKSATRRWPIAIFYNIIDIALINSWITYKSICKVSKSRKSFIQDVVHALTGNTPQETFTQLESSSREESTDDKTRKRCSTRKCPNKTREKCFDCKKSICGKCAIKFCKNCKE